MKRSNLKLPYTIFKGIGELEKADADLMKKAVAELKKSFAPYSKFHVAAAALLANGKIVTGTNQESAAYSVTVCAERVLLGNAAMQFNGVAVNTIAITYHNEKNPDKNESLISPCGMCRQALADYELRFKQPMKIIMGSVKGEIIVVESAKHLLPFAFSDDNL